MASPEQPLSTSWSFWYDRASVSEPYEDALQRLGTGFDPGVDELDVCQGDCDNDDDCKGCLKCFKRSNGEPVPGCSGDVFDPRLDFCYAP